jgi:two-component system sensor histidine kinase BaeS
LAACLVAMAVGSLVVAVMVTAALARSTARADARRDLTDAADGLSQLAGVNLANLSRRLGRVLDVDGVGVVFATPGGEVVAGPDLASRPRRRDTLLPRRVTAGLPLPVGVAVGDLDGQRLWSGTTQTGGSGRRVFVAHPLEPLAGGALRPVVVLTRQVGLLPLGRSGPLLLLAAALAAAIAVAVALWLARRLTRPLQAMERATRAIAGGDLGARVGGLAGADDELARLGAAIDTMAAELERAAGLERAFLMSVSHDLRTPLTSIRGYAEAVAEGATDDDESRRRAAMIIGSEARRLERLVADLLDLARLDAREFSLHPRPVDAAAVVAGAVEALQPAAAEAGLRLATTSFISGTPQAPGISGTPRAPGISGTPRAPGISGTPRAPGPPLPATLDPERLAQMVANLVENALKYAATTVEVGVHPTPAGLEISVIDDGPGVDPADLPHVFERLYTSRRQNIGGTPNPGPGRKVGTGLGLAIVAQLAEAMGGKVEAGRTPEGLTRFAVSVAVHPDESSSSSGGGSSSSSSASASSSSSRTTAPSS